jgi:hypothetical protein
VNCIADEPATEVFYRRLHSVVDDFGRFTAHPSLLRAALYPLRLDKITDAEVSEHLEACASAGLIHLYHVAGKPYLEVLDFHQRTRAKASKFPPPEGYADTIRQGDGWHVAGRRPTRDSQATDTGRSCDGHPQAETETETETETEAEARADGALPLDEFFEERYSRHPKKRDRILAEQALAGIPGIETNQVQDEFRRGHEAWIATDDYTWKGGAKCPTFAEFITDRTWRYPPPATAGGDDGGESVIDRAIADWRRATEERAA